MESNDKIPSPFKAPDGYFEDFEKKIFAKMADPTASQKPQLKVGYKKYLRIEWIAAAATFAAIVVTAWFIFNPNGQKNKIAKITPLQKTDTLTNKTVIADTAQHHKNELAVVESVLDEATIASSPKADIMQTQQEKNIATELEDAGLIVLETENSLFDEIEFTP
jgi:hypothetical protein